MRETIRNLGREIETTIRVFYALKQFRLWVSRQKDVDRINKNPDFWWLFESSARTNLFIGIRRLYESKNGTFNFQIAIEECVKNIDDFSTSAIRARKIEASKSAYEWIDDCMACVYEPVPEDFYALSKLVRLRSKKMRGPYSDAASKVYAHAVHMDDPSLSKIHDDLIFDEIEKALESIWHSYSQISEMYHNGRKPVLEISKYPHVDEVVNCLERQLG